MDNIEATAVAHEPDAAWLIALWLAIHGGDPAPDGAVSVDETTALLATTLSLRLSEAYGVELASPEVLQARLADIGIALSGDKLPKPRAELRQNVEQVGGRCLSINGTIWCVKPAKPVQGVMGV
jgi:hypothetical protein